MIAQEAFEAHYGQKPMDAPRTYRGFVQGWASRDSQVGAKGLTLHWFPLRSDLLVRLELPSDFNAADEERLRSFLTALALPTGETS